MSESTRRQFLGGAAAAAAATVLTPPTLAGAQSGPAPAPTAPSPPVGPTSPYGVYQSEIYISGMTAGVEPIFTTNLFDLEAVAAKVLSSKARRYLLASAGGAAAVLANTRALREWRIVPRMFIDRDDRDISTKVLGVWMPAPVILGPVGRQTLAHPDGELASARAAAGLDLTYVHSSRSSRPVEAVAAAAPQGSRWFGLDWPDGNGRDLETTLVRAKAAGCTHLVLSAPQPGERWGALAKVRRAWDGPIVLSGVQSVQAARMAVRRGFDGIVVSNERGRRGRRPEGTIDRLPRVVDSIGGKVAVLFGSGVRTGPDVYRALALGAEAVLIGRPYVHGLGLAGEDGVRHVLRTLLAELETNLAIAGVDNHRKLDPGALVRA
ncbi:MAG TPA: alpha-hydroxy-acid oxidizing protein [Solirubrobacterales bacterium]|nr:alpha-hydroxy-acid oxidizing protein [Solirubrobacterales bacterium]